LISLFSCAEKVTIEGIDREESAGNFAKASKWIDLYIAENELSEQEIYELNFRKDVMKRIELDFNKTKDDVTKYIQKYYPDVHDEMLDKWVADGSLESMTINGERKYFDRSAPNLFRISKEEKQRKQEVDGQQKPDSKVLFLQKNIPDIIAGKSNPVTVKFQYTVTLKPNAVPDGETVRCWLPYPNENCERQSDIKLIAASDRNYIISPMEYAHRTLYMEKTAEKDEPTVFKIAFSYQSVSRLINLEDTLHRFPVHAPFKRTIEAKLSPEELKEYVSERPPHIVFSEKIKELSAKIVGNETSPYSKVKKIFTYIDENYPWAGAREYSTIPNIPEYVIKNGHGDCGQKTLLFITLARYNNIPAKWESGFMIHPGNENLHDWGAYYLEGTGWIPIDQSFGINKWAANEQEKYFYMNGTDAYHFVVNTDYSQLLFPAKIYPRSETVDFQRGELEWRGGNLYFDKWNWDMEISY
jgi:transglutaminase-like putative cysteine protease